MRVEFEPVAIGFRVELNAQHVAPRHHRRQIDQSAASMDVGARTDAPGTLYGRNGRRNDQPVDRQRSDANVEARQDRAFLARWHQLGQPRQRRARHVQARDIEPVDEVPQRCPVELGARRREHQPLGITHAHINQRRLTVDRSVDPPDAVAQAVGRLHARDAVGQETVADAAVHQAKRGERQQQWRHQHRDNNPPPAAALDQRRCGRGRVLAQNAWPSDT